MQRLIGMHPSSLGLHPAVYFYSTSGRYQPTSFLAMLGLLADLEKENGLKHFIKVRPLVENFVIKYKYFVTQIVYKYGSGMKGYLPLKKLFRTIIDSFHEGQSEAEVIKTLKSTKELSFLTTEQAVGPTGQKKDFSSGAKSATFLKEALTKAVRCTICGGYMHSKAITIDHRIAKSKGGGADPENAQLAHPYCNSTIKQSN